MSALTWRGDASANPFLRDLAPAFDAYRAGDYARAGAAFDRLSAAYPDAVEVLFYQGVSRMLAGKLGLAALDREGDDKLVGDLFEVLQQAEIDMTLFFRRLADVPARTPQQWPGAGGRVDYSEGLLVGYRWYDAEHIQPEFPFGFGLSYTTFRLSHLTVTPHAERGTVGVQTHMAQIEAVHQHPATAWPMAAITSLSVAAPLASRTRKLTICAPGAMPLKVFE